MKFQPESYPDDAMDMVPSYFDVKEIYDEKVKPNNKKRLQEKKIA